MKRSIKCFMTVTIVLFLLTTHASAYSYIITGNHVRVHSDANFNDNNVVAKLNSGDEIFIMENHGQYVQIQANNVSGFVSSDYVGLEISSHLVAITNTKLHFRAGPSIHEQSFGIIPKNTVLKIIGFNSNWAQVEYQNHFGFVCADYLTQKNIEEGKLLSTYTTFFSPKQKGRTNNIKKASKLVNESIVQPGHTFSLLTAIGPITQSAGYFEAPEFKRTSSGAQTVMGYGGGVCQLATTLYQCICNAQNASSNIDIVERHTHSKPVSYAKMGSDATISWNAGQDFQFKNHNVYSMKIICFVVEDSITCAVLRMNE